MERVERVRSVSQRYVEESKIASSDMGQQAGRSRETNAKEGNRGGTGIWLSRSLG